MENNYGLLMTLLFPMVGGIIGFFLGKKNKETRNDWIDIVMTVELIMLLYIGYRVIAKGEIFSLGITGALGLGFSLNIGVVRLLACTVSVIVFGTIAQFMKESMKDEEGSNRFYLFYMCIMSMVLGAFMTTNLFNLFMFMTFAVLFAYPLIMHRKDAMALRNADIYLRYTVAACAVIFTGLMIVFAYLGSVSYDGMYTALHTTGGSNPVLFGGLLLFVGFGVFAGFFPVQLQVTRGSSYGLMEISAILSSVVSKLGLYAILLLGANLLVENTFYGKVVIVVSLATAIWGLLISLTATDIRKILMGLNVAVNGFNGLAIAMVSLCGSSNGYAIRSSLYMVLASSLAMLALYMVALEQVRRINTYEIKGLIAAGKGQKLLMIVCLLAGASLAGVPGTAGYLAHSLLFRSILTSLGWKWLMVLYVILWAFLMTAVLRIFMKLFVSKKEETLRILTTDEELKAQQEKQKDKKPKNTVKTYFYGELLLLFVELLQIFVGILPALTVDTLSESIGKFFNGPIGVTGSIPYFTSDALIAVAVAAVLCGVLYVNLVHGVLLRAVRNKKNKKLQKMNKES